MLTCLLQWTTCCPIQSGDDTKLIWLFYSGQDVYMCGFECHSPYYQIRNVLVNMSKLSFCQKKWSWLLYWVTAVFFTSCDKHVPDSVTLLGTFYLHWVLIFSSPFLRSSFLIVTAYCTMLQSLLSKDCYQQGSRYTAASVWVAHRDDDILTLLGEQELRTVCGSWQLCLPHT